MYHPDGYQFIKIDNNGECFYKLFASFSGNFSTGDSWKLNSGCTKVEDNGDGTYSVHGHTGSVYVIPKEGGVITSYNASALQRILNNSTPSVTIIEVDTETAITEINSGVI
jgi:hypothetical protein